MKKVYIVVYYGIDETTTHAVFSTEEEAQRFIDAGGCGFLSSKGETEEWTVDEYVRPEGYPYVVDMDKDGDSMVRMDECVIPKIGQHKFGAERVGPVWSKEHKTVLHLWTFAQNQEEAIKIADQKRQELIAENKWIEIVQVK